MAFPITPTADLKVRYTRDPVTRTYLVDLVLSPFGDLQLVTGLDRLEQDVRRWLQIQLGSYIFDVTWGDPLWAERGRPQPAQVEDLIRASLGAAEDGFLRAQAHAAAQGFLSTDEMLDHFEDVQVLTYPTDPGRVDVLFTLVARSGNNRPAELWVPAGPFLAPAVQIALSALSVTALPGSVGPLEEATVTVRYNGAVGDTVILSADVGTLSLVCDGDPSTLSFVVTETPVNLPYSGCTLTYTAPAALYGAGVATITAHAFTGGALRASGTATMLLRPAPPLTLAFEEPTVPLGGEDALLVTYAGTGAVLLSVPEGQGTLGSYEVVGDGTPQTWSIPYTAPATSLDTGEFMPGSGFFPTPGAVLPMLVTATGTDGLATATATVWVLATPGSALQALPGQITLGGALDVTPP